MTDEEVYQIIEKKQKDAYRRAVIASNKRVQYEQGHRARLEQAERMLRYGWQ